MYSDESKLSRILDLGQTVVLIILNYKFAGAMLEKGSVREDALAAFEFGWVRRQ